ncbi:hypothetical protein U9M48_021469 [Paspalum notatum var. saurae]|uniref:Ribosomal protein L5 n=1 Tax=Paspalum notatum var. saurae TaxID=547442 RepID=A0AAQ3WSQ8_PASNO
MGHSRWPWPKNIAQPARVQSSSSERREGGSASPHDGMAARYRLLRGVASAAAARGHRVPVPGSEALAAGPGSRSVTQGTRHYATPSSVEEAVGNLEVSPELDAPKANRTRSSIPKKKKNGVAMMLPLHFHYEDVLRQDLLLKQNHDNIMQVPGLHEIKLAPRATSDLKLPIGKLAMEVLSGQRFKEAEVDPFAKARKSSRTNPFMRGDKDSGSALAQQSVLRGQAMYNFLVKMVTVMSMLGSRAEVRENTIKFFMETEFCEFSPELDEHFEIFEQIRGFNVTVVTTAGTKDETSLLWSGFALNDDAET